MTKDKQHLLERVKEYVLGLEVAADCERRIFTGYKPEWDLWETRNADPDFKSDDRLVQMIRNALDARNNAEKYERQAEALQSLLVENELRDELLRFGFNALENTTGEVADEFRRRFRTLLGDSQP